MPIQPYSFFMPKKAHVESAGIGIACGQAKGRFRRFVFPGAEHRKGGAANGKSRRTGEDHPQMQ